MLQSPEVSGILVLQIIATSSGSLVNDVQRQRLKVLLNYWIEHNREHAGELEEWAEKAKALGEELSAELLRAARQMKEAGKTLSRVLENLEPKT